METITVHAMFGKAVLKDIAISNLHSGAYQPRDIFSDESLESLSKTIAHLGVLEPLIVRASTTKHDLFEIVAGERRFRAAKLAGLTVVPCLLSNYSNEQAAQITLIENTCREALNPIAEALAMQRITTEFNYTHDEIGVLLGMSRSRVTNLLRLLNLDARIQHWMKLGSLSEGHGKLLAGLPLEKQYWYAYEAIKKEWTVSVLDDAIKPLDDSLSSMNIHYLRFQDNLIAFCKTKKQLNRCRKRMMEVLNERQLKLSRKKSRMGSIESGFHFLGVNYSPPRMENNTTISHTNDDFIDQSIVNSLTIRGGGKTISNHQQHESLQIVPHPRTLRKAREYVKQMVADGISFRKIRRYLYRWGMWWQNTSNNTWEYQVLLQQFIDVCWHENVTAYAAGFYQLHLIKLNTLTFELAGVAV